MKFTKRSIESIEATDKRQVLFDDDFTGFALRVSPAGKKTFYYSYRPGKGRGAEKKWVSIGAFPAWTVEQAREKAKDLAAAVQQGTDPAQAQKEDKEAITMKSALEMFKSEHVAKLKPKTVKLYGGIIDNYMLPAMGKTKVKNISNRDIAKLHQAMKATPYYANRMLAAASSFFNWCEACGYRGRASNPCQGVTKYKEQLRQSFMGEVEISLLGETVSKLEGEGKISPQAAAAIRLLMFTGARVGEVLSLQWQHIDLERGVATLPDSKTGFKILQLPAPAVALLEALPCYGEWVFPAVSASGHMVNIAKPWGIILKESGLSGWRLHDLRHAFASMMVNSGASLPIVGKILGHNNVTTTQRYAHLEQNPARKAAEDAAAKIAQALKAQPKKGKVIKFKDAAGE